MSHCNLDKRATPLCLHNDTTTLAGVEDLSGTLVQDPYQRNPAGIKVMTWWCTYDRNRTLLHVLRQYEPLSRNPQLHQSTHLPSLAFAVSNKKCRINDHDKQLLAQCAEHHLVRFHFHSNLKAVILLSNDCTFSTSKHETIVPIAFLDLNDCHCRTY